MMRSICDARHLPGDLQVRRGRRHRLCAQRRFPRIRHHVHADERARLRIARRRLPVLDDERRDAECGRSHVLQIGRHARSPVDRDSGIAAGEAVLRIGVAASRVAHDLDA